MIKKILVVDDDPDDREAISRALRQTEHRDWSVSHAWDESSCMAQVDSNGGFACILLDYSMPGRDGLKTMQQLLAKDPFAAIIIVTGAGDEALAVHALKLGAYDYISKDSIEPCRLEAAINNALKRAEMSRHIEEQRQSLTVFSRVLVHDLRSPLQTIMHSITMLANDLPKDVVQEHGEKLTFVRMGVDRMDSLIQALSQYNAIDATESLHEEIELSDIVSAVQANLRLELDEVGAKITYSPDLPKIRVIPAQFVQLLQNLVANGIRYNKSAVPEIRISVHESATTLDIEVTDNGIGMNEEQLESAFDPFKRFHTYDDVPGTGLGLAICKKIAERHNARLSCQSEVGVGTTMVLSLPQVVQKNTAV